VGAGTLAGSSWSTTMSTPPGGHCAWPIGVTISPAAHCSGVGAQVSAAVCTATHSQCRWFSAADTGPYLVRDSSWAEEELDAGVVADAGGGGGGGGGGAGSQELECGHAGSIVLLTFAAALLLCLVLRNKLFSESGSPGDDGETPATPRQLYSRALGEEDEEGGESVGAHSAAPPPSAPPATASSPASSPPIYYELSPQAAIRLSDEPGVDASPGGYGRPAAVWHERRPAHRMASTAAARWAGALGGGGSPRDGGQQQPPQRVDSSAAARQQWLRQARAQALDEAFERSPLHNKPVRTLGGNVGGDDEAQNTSGVDIR
jgi:hypothetical protein